MGTVLVTRAESEAAPLTALLRARGLHTRCVSLLERVVHAEAVASAVAACPRPEVLLLTSRFTVSLLAPHVARLQPSRTVAVGPGTARQATTAGFEVEPLLAGVTGEDLVVALGPIDGVTVLYPHAREATLSTTAALERGGAIVRHVLAYTTHTPEGLHEQLGCPESVDLTLLTAGSSAGRLAEHWPGAPVVAIGPSTATAAEDQGLRVLGVAREPTLEALADAVERALRRLQGSSTGSVSGKGRI